MKITRYSSLSLVAFMASMSLGTALADSTDDALNQFYVDNMATRLSAEVPASGSENPPPSQKGVKEEKAHKGAKTHKGNGVQAQASQASNGFFSYRSSPAVTGKVHANFLALAGQDPQKIARFQKELATNLENRFDARFSRYGFSSRNAADSYAGLVIVLWEIVNNQNASAHPAGIRQVRVKVSELLAGKAGLKTLPDTSKQYFSEYVKLLAVSLSDAMKQKEATNNASEIANARNIAYQSSLKLGVDLKKLQLTDSGFKKI
jgi:hypothetical protein